MKPTEGDKQPKLSQLLALVSKHLASDLHMKAGWPVRLRVGGNLAVLKDLRPFTSEQIETMVMEMLSPRQQAAFQDAGTVDYAFEMPDGDRFRINAFRQRGKVSVAARRVPAQVPKLSELNLPASFSRLADFPDGMVLFCGPTGCGKSTSMAALVDRINHVRSCHILTIEDPIEFIFRDDRAVVNQREIGIDVADYVSALRSMLREDPDVLLITELRDAESFAAALRAAETGHLVLATVHAGRCWEAISRMVEMFPTNRHELVRQTIRFTLRAVVTQRLLPSVRPEARVVPAVEVLFCTPIVQKLIEEGRLGELPDAVKRGIEEGMMDLNRSLHELLANEWITRETALENSPNPDELLMYLRGIRRSSGT